MVTTTDTNATKQPSTASALLERMRVDAATAFDLYSQIKQAHWTVTGESFIAVHELFDKQAAAMRGHIDELSERIRQLGGVPSGTARQASALSEIPDLPDHALSVEQATSEISRRYRTLADRVKESAQVAADFQDVATEDIYIAILRDLDLQEWFLRSHIS